MTFNIHGSNFKLNNKKIFLNSGEIHYFRIKRGLWNKHLQEAKKAGLTTISTYIPWAWHEEVEGDFDFNGNSNPEKDLEGWLQCCKEHNLHCIVKPGPFILAETRGAGLPDWFIQQYGREAKMHNSKGETVQSDGVYLFHDVFLAKVRHWYDHIMPFISKHEISSGGPVIMMQVCNEIGVFSWLAHQGDYSNGVKERFQAFLSARFGTIEKINRLWGTAYRDFDSVPLPPDGRLPFTSRGDRSRDYEWHAFWRTYYRDYLKLLAGMIRDRGITVPLYHNLPGWIYGHGYEFPVNITMYEELYGEKSEIIFGIDHIPEFMSYRNMHDDRIINDITFAMQGEKPLFAAEFQCGSREYHVVPNQRELELFYKASLANGLVGWNYYMFSQGRNPRRRGYSGDTFYWFTPLTAEGERTSIYPLIGRMSKMVKTLEDIILKAERKAEVGVLFYPPYYATELERPEEGASGLLFDYARIRRPAYFDGLLKVLQVLNIDYDMLDLNQASTENLLHYKQVWAFCTDEMNAREQEVIMEYTREGGKLVIFPNLPDREMSQAPCTIIRDALNIHPSGWEIIDSPLIDVFDMMDIKCANPQVVYNEKALKNEETIARTIRGTACGFKKGLGKGSVIHLGTWIGFDTQGHKPVYETILSLSGAKLRQAYSDSENITVRERFAEGTAMLFIANYYNEEYEGRITYTHPDSGENITIPYQGGSTMWPALYGALTPLCLEIAAGLKILHSTSDILGFNKEKLEITLFGDRDLKGETVLEGTRVENILSVELDGKPVELARDGKRLVLKYMHKHRKEMVLVIHKRQP